MGKVYNNLISTTAGFNYAAEQPLDDRAVVQSKSDLDALVRSNVSYDGMRVYVVYEKKSYILTDNEWVAIATENAANINAQAIDTHLKDTENPHKVTKEQVELGDVVNTGDGDTPVKDGKTKFTTGGAYTELAKKVDKTTTVNGHALSGNVDVTKSDVGLGNVDNKSSATILGELTGKDIVDKLGYTPLDANDAAGSSLGLVKSGGDATISDGVISLASELKTNYGAAYTHSQEKHAPSDAEKNAEYSITKDTNSGAYAAVYHLTKDGSNVGAAINIPKDLVVKSGSVVTNPTGQTEGTYIKLVLQNVDDPLYINVSNLIEYVTSGSQTGDMVVVSVSDDHKVTAAITDGSITSTKLHKDVKDSIDSKMAPNELSAAVTSTSTLDAGSNATASATWDATNKKINFTFGIPKGEQGVPGEDGVDGTDGVGIAKSEINANGELVLTYTNGDSVNLGKVVGSNGANGNDGANGENGKDGANGKDGIGIANIAKTSTSGKVDTYTITLTDSSAYTFTVTNGQDGEDGAGELGVDFLEITNTETDAVRFAYNVGEGSNITMDDGTIYLTDTTVNGNLTATDVCIGDNIRLSEKIQDLDNATYTYIYLGDSGTTSGTLSENSRATIAQKITKTCLRYLIEGQNGDLHLYAMYDGSHEGGIMRYSGGYNGVSYTAEVNISTGAWTLTKQHDVSLDTNNYTKDSFKLEATNGVKISCEQEDTYLKMGQTGITLEANVQDQTDINLMTGHSVNIQGGFGVHLKETAGGSQISVNTDDILVRHSEGASIQLSDAISATGNLLVNGDLTVSGTINGSTSSGITGTVPIEQGGTGATTATNARANLGIETCSDTIGSDYNVPHLGDNPQPIWIKDGVPTAMTGSCGDKFNPVYMLGGKLTTCNPYTLLLDDYNFKDNIKQTVTLNVTSTLYGNLVFLGRQGHDTEHHKTLASAIIPKAAISESSSAPTTIWLSRDGGYIRLKLYKDVSYVYVACGGKEVNDANPYYVNYVTCYEVM